MTTKAHWEKVYTTKEPHEVSWTQAIPKTSLDFIHSFDLPKDARIIDIGGGDSNLVDFLLEEGYTNVSVLDISEAALERARRRLGKKADLVTWIASDITEFNPTRSYDLWHDRATFHFLTQADQIEHYRDITGRSVSQYLVLGTFSDLGPEKCSGLAVHRYAEGELVQAFSANFEKLKCLREDHMTPFATTQNFLYCSFRKKLPHDRKQDH